MDLLALRVDLEQGQLAVVLRDASGCTTHALGGAALARWLEEAAPLLEQLRASHGSLRSMDVDAIAGTLRLGTAAGEVVLGGADYAQLRPLLREPARLAVREARPRQPDPPGLQSEAEVWEHKYRVGSDGWELMRSPPPLERFVAEHPPSPGARALVPGCGRGHEARLLARYGAQVVAVDIAPSAVVECRRLAADQGLLDRIEVAMLDFLQLPEAHHGRYDLVLEHCCYCAIDPRRRDDYVAAAAAALRPGGRLLGLFWCHPYPGGPPYGGSPEEVIQRFLRAFDMLHSEVPPDSILTRSGQELILYLEKKHALSRR
ncbi:MAG: methyltransferase domain-containing protein [Myxococcales bacterium]|nr:TPMT family class I SAM-dependent methyltransferase [Myxococcota bacterium]MDW8280505.1 methyltransferase domain-containing protein [Myxococcales bacterium]